VVVCNQSLLQQQLNEAAEIVAQYIDGTLENCFLICRICGFLTTCYF
jgi:hypothetical protein